MAAMQLIPSPKPEKFNSSEKGNNVHLQTTPKLSKEERLATLSRLMASEHFIHQKLDRQESLKSCRRSFNKICFPDNSEDVPDKSFHASPIPLNRTLFDSPKNKEKGKSAFLLPFSPKLNPSLCYNSPSYRVPTPTRSPLYVTDSQKGFLGRGSFGKVTLCTYKGVKYALKVTHDKNAYIGERNFINIRHPHLVSVLHIAPVQDRMFICMEFAGHCNLQQVLDTKSELDFPRRLRFTEQIALALRHCHQRHIVHGDVKPSNVIVSPFGICKLGDFGNSSRIDSSTQQTHQSDNIVGTAAYAAPEVLRGSKPGLPSDIYSFGILLWQVETRNLPYAGEHPHVIIYKVTRYGLRPEYRTSICKTYEQTAKCCWREEPNQRPEITGVLRSLQDIKKQFKEICK